jgi:hypothetical protein
VDERDDGEERDQDRERLTHRRTSWDRDDANDTAFASVERRFVSTVISDGERLVAMTRAT